MKFLSLLEQGAATSTGSPFVLIIAYIVIFGGAFYFMAIRPQKKQQKQHDALMTTLEAGDSVLTTSGFYGVCIDVSTEDDVVIVEFGNNKNCRIPMKKDAIVEIEKSE